MKKNIGIKILKVALIVVLSTVFAVGGSFLGDLFLFPFKNSGNDAIIFAGQYFNFIGIWIVIIIACLFRKNNRKLLKKLIPFCGGNKWKRVLAIGLTCGIGINLLIGIIALVHGDIALSFNEFNPAMILLFIVCITVQSGAEELVERFYVYQKVGELFPEVPIVPVIVNAIAFSALHIFNTGITVLALVNITLVGILYSLIIYYFDCFWAAVVAHASWNFCQNILLGLPNSGIVSAYSIFKLDASTAVNSFAYNVKFGIESTILSSIFLAIACVVIIFVGMRRKVSV